MRRCLVVSALCLAVAGTAEAQTRTAYAVGMDLARSRGYANAGCYATVFAHHALRVERHDGRTGWLAASTPAYNAELRQRCGIDRLSHARARREAASPSSPLAGDPRAVGGPYLHGLRIARQRGYSGAKAHCLAQVFVKHATLRPSLYRAGVVDWSATAGPALRGEMFSSCGISI